MPQINWELGMSTAPDGHYTQRFFDRTQDLFLHQHVLEPTACPALPWSQQK